MKTASPINLQTLPSLPPFLPPSLPDLPNNSGSTCTSKVTGSNSNGGPPSHNAHTLVILPAFPPSLPPSITNTLVFKGFPGKRPIFCHHLPFPPSFPSPFLCVHTPRLPNLPSPAFSCAKNLAPRKYCCRK